MTLESAGVGVSSVTTGVQYRNYSIDVGLGMMALDTVLYALLALYIEQVNLALPVYLLKGTITCPVATISQVLPSRFRSYGLPKPWYFPCTARFIRRLFPSCAHTLASDNRPRVPRLSSAGDNAELKIHVDGPPGMCDAVESWNNGASSMPGMGSGGAADSAVVCGTEDLADSEAGAAVEVPDAELRDRAAAGRALTVSHMRKEFHTTDGVKVAVDDASLVFYEGQVSILLGHNGAGKVSST